MDRAEEGDGRVHIRVSDLPDRRAIDPGQQRIAMITINPYNTGDIADIAPLHQCQRADFGAKPVAGIRLSRGILLEREIPRAAVDTIDSAVAPACGGKMMNLDRCTEQGFRNASRFDKS